MLGAIIGDVAGSYYEVLEIEYKVKYKKNRPYEERIKILDKNVPLFLKNSSVTDDSILTCAIYDAIKNGRCCYQKYLRKYGLKELGLGNDIYGRTPFSKGFINWLYDENANCSYGNGAAMRISPVGFCFNTVQEVKKQAYLATITSHNSTEAIKSSQCIALAIMMLKNHVSKENVINFVKENYYKLDFSLEDLQRNYTFTPKAENSVPQAIYVFSVSASFEDTIRNAISIGGDTDTIAAIAGSLAESYYGIDFNLKQEVKPYLKDYMYELLEDRYYLQTKIYEKKK